MIQIQTRPARTFSLTDHRSTFYFDKKIKKELMALCLEGRKEAAGIFAKEVTNALNNVYPDDKSAPEGSPPAKHSGELQAGLYQTHNLFTTKIGFRMSGAHAHLLELGTEKRFRSHYKGYQYKGAQGRTGASRPRPFFLPSYQKVSWDMQVVMMKTLYKLGQIKSKMEEEKIT